MRRKGMKKGCVEFEDLKFSPYPHEHNLYCEVIAIELDAERKESEQEKRNRNQD